MSRSARRLSYVSIAGVTMLMCAVGARAESDAQSTEDERWQTVLQELAELRQDNQSLRGEVDELRASTTDNWLTEQRAEQIRAIVADTLADADTRASLMSNGMVAGWHDGFFLASPDGRFKLQLEGQLQFRFVYNYHDQLDRHRWGFEHTRTKLAFRGHVFGRHIEYLVRGNFNRQGGTFGLEDAWTRFHMNDEWSLRIGQFKLPFNREELVSSAYQLAVERSLINESLNIGRTEGVELQYAADTWNWKLATGDGAADNFGGFELLNAGEGFNEVALTQDVEYALTTRFEFLLAGDWEQFEDFTSPPDDTFGMLLGIAGHVQESENNGFTSLLRNETDFYEYTADLSMEWGGANAFISWTHGYMDAPAFNLNIYGVVVQGGVYIAPKWEVFGRFEWGEFDLGPVASRADLNLLTVGFNYYLDGHDAKWTTDIGFGISRIRDVWDADIAGFRQDDEEARPQIVFRTQFQLLF